MISWLNAIRVNDSESWNALKIARIPRDDDSMGGIGAGGDQGVWYFDADRFPNLNRPFNHRVGNSNFFKLIQQSADGCFFLLAEVGKT